MADFESIVKRYADGDGNIPADAIAKLTKAIATTVGNEFVEKSRYKAKLEEIDTLTEEKQTAQDSATTAEKWKTKYNALKDDFAAYKSDQAKKETHATKEKAFRGLLRELNIPEKHHDAIVRVSDVDGMELDADGKTKDAETLKKTLKGEWDSFIPSTEVRGANTATPPRNDTNRKMSKEEIYKRDDHGRYLLSASERQKALMENHNNT